MRIYDMGLNNRYGRDFMINRPLWTRDYLLIHFRTPAAAVINGKKEYVEQGSIIVFHVGTPHHYYAVQDTYADDFIHFFIDDDYDFITKLEIPFNSVLKLPKTTIFCELLEAIHREYISNNKNKAASIDLLMKLLFTKLNEFIFKHNVSTNFYRYYDLLHKLKKSIYANPKKKWTVPEMAGFCNLSPSYFQVLYKQAFNTTCINDAINSRIQLAKSLLSTQKISIKEIALLCGYHNNEYFMRQFKKCTGYTPSQYRNLFFGA